MINMKKITPRHITVKRKLSKEKMTHRVRSAGPTEVCKTDRTHEEETAKSKVYQSLYL